MFISIIILKQNNKKKKKKECKPVSATGKSAFQLSFDSKTAKTCSDNGKMSRARAHTHTHIYITNSQETISKNSQATISKNSPTQICL